MDIFGLKEVGAGVCVFVCMCVMFMYVCRSYFMYVHMYVCVCFSSFFDYLISSLQIINTSDIILEMVPVPGSSTSTNRNATANSSLLGSSSLLSGFSSAAASIEVSGVVIIILLSVPCSRELLIV